MNALLSVYLYFKNLFDSEEGQDMIEYALIIVVFVLVAVVGIAALNEPMKALWANIAGKLGSSN